MANKYIFQNIQKMANKYIFAKICFINTYLLKYVSKYIYVNTLTI